MTLTGISAAQDTIGHGPAHWRKQAMKNQAMLDEALEVVDYLAEVVETMNARVIELERANPAKKVKTDV